MAVRLTAARIRALPKGVYCDEFGLRLKVQASGSRQWVWRGMVGGKRRDLGLGAFPLVGLKEAREMAFDYRRKARQGEDPRPQRRGIPTFAETAQEHLPHKRPDWTGVSAAKQEQNWQAVLANYINPKLGRMRVDAVTRGDIKALLNGLADKPSVPGRALMQIRAVLAWAVEMEYRADNPAKEVTVGKAKVTHHAAMPHAEVAGALARLRGAGEWQGAALALEFTVLTAARHVEVRGATWGEIDMDAATWTVPAGRMKARVEHRVPLSAQALAILQQAAVLGDGRGFVFPSVTGRQISGSKLPAIMSRLAPEVTVHGFRSSFRDWAAEAGYPRELAERALAHVVGGAASSTEAAYMRTTLFEQRRPMMQAWADHVAPGV